MAKPPGRCIFCGGYGLTKEHVFPNWLRTIFPRLSTDTHTFGSFDWNATPNITQAISATRNTAQGQVGSKKVKVVCKACNNGWLSLMEQATKPLLEGMVLGTTESLSVAEQCQLAAWIAKTTMTAEFIYPKEVAITQGERDEFRRCGEPGPHWQIWIAFYIGMKQIAGGIFHHGLGLYLPPRPMKAGVKNTQFTVMGLGRMLTINISTEENRLAVGLRSEAEIALKRIWPPTDGDLVWPPMRSIDDDGADRIIASFGNMLGTPLRPI